MWLFPLPALLATTGFVFVLVKRPNAIVQIRYAAVILFIGVIVYLIRAWFRGEWPFASAMQQGRT
jgi:hypothetical protein